MTNHLLNFMATDPQGLEQLKNILTTLWYILYAVIPLGWGFFIVKHAFAVSRAEDDESRKHALRGLWWCVGGLVICLLANAIAHIVTVVVLNNLIKT